MKNISLAIWSVVFVIFAGSVNAQSNSTYDKCLTALAEGDLDQAKTLAAEIESKINLTQENILKATRCLEEAFGDIFWYNPDYKFWTKGNTAIKMKKLAEKRKLQDKVNRKEQCLFSKRNAIDKMKVYILDVMAVDNKNLIAIRTLSACVELNEIDPNAAILNPICRESFTNNLHPDLENQDLLEQYQELNSEDAVARLDLMETQLELAQMENKPAPANYGGKSIREQAFQTCE